MATILIVDDHPVLRHGIRKLLEVEEDYEICGEADGRRDALSLLDKHQPDLAIIDLLLRNEDGLELVKECAARYENLKILVMTMQDEAVYAERVIRAGADGFITKHQAVTHIIEAVQTILDGEVYLSRTVSARLLGRMLKQKDGGEETRVKSLSDRELHVFQLIGAGMATKDIAESLGLSPKTIETYREKIKVKLDLSNAEQLRREARRWVETGTLD